jgi:hypothetical protein
MMTAAVSKKHKTETEKTRCLAEGDYLSQAARSNR